MESVKPSFNRRQHHEDYLPLYFFFLAELDELGSKVSKFLELVCARKGEVRNLFIFYVFGYEIVSNGERYPEKILRGILLDDFRNQGVIDCKIKKVFPCDVACQVDLDVEISNYGAQRVVVVVVSVV